MPDLPRRPALFLDLDGTVRETLSGRVHPLEPWDQQLRPGVSDRVREYRDRGYAIVGVTNQGGVALGILTEDDVLAINQRLMTDLAPRLFDLILYCPYHPHSRLPTYRHHADCRKPRPGMAFEARRQLGVDLGASIMVGDSDADQGFARNAGIGRFYWADEFFADEDGVVTIEQPHIAAE